MQINGMNFTIGADPELFVKKAGAIVSAFGLVGGTKDKPIPVRNGAVQVDGMALEFNIDPAHTEDEFQLYLADVQAQLAEMVGDYEFTKDVSVMFESDYIKSQPIEAVILGCSVDYNGYSLSANPSPDASGNLRTVGGHIHIGGMDTDDPFDTNHFYSVARLIRILDEELGVYSILWDKDDKRRSMYGQAGAFRPKKYGVEYRTLSNSWIFNQKLVSFVYQGVERALNKMFNPEHHTNPEIPDIINNSRRDHPFFKGNETAEYIKSLV